MSGWGSLYTGISESSFAVKRLMKGAWRLRLLRLDCIVTPCSESSDSNVDSDLLKSLAAMSSTTETESNDAKEVVPPKKPDEVKKDVKPQQNDASGGAKVPTFQERFRIFSKFGDTKSDGKHITLSQSDKWMKQASVIDGKKITTTDTGIYFKKFKQQKVGYVDYGKFLEELARVKKVEVADMKLKMRSCGEPGLAGTTSVVKNSAVERLSDTPKKKDDSKVKSTPRKVKSPT